MAVMSKPTFFYIHGGDAYASEAGFIESLTQKPLRDPRGEGVSRWTDDLRSELAEQYDVFTPQMPNKQNAHYHEWKIWFERHFDYFTAEVILLGWSLGGIFLAKYLSENQTPFSVKRLYFLAAPFCTADLKDIDCGDFLLDPELIAYLPEKAAEIILMHAKDDFVVPYAHMILYQQLLQTAECVTFTDKNHFLLETFPELYTHLRS